MGVWVDPRLKTRFGIPAGHPLKVLDYKLTTSSAMDMLMLTLFNSREREKDDWLKLFEKADKRFVFSQAGTPKGSALGIIEVQWQG